jgi:glyoxylase-like metal-dependent hydrolase (beta-lactamase superfamily II)
MHGHGHDHPHAHSGGSRSGHALQRLSPSLYWYRDTCNVYVVTREEHAILIDFGSGGVLDHLHEAGVRQVDWVLHTHHHRDQCQGDHLLPARGIPIAVPEREAALFAETDAFWRLKRIYDNYDVSSVGFTLPRPVPVARALRDYETFAWRGLEIRVLPTPGHTKGSVTYVADVDGLRTAFSGDLIAEPGKLHTIHDLQWQYGLPDAVGAALHSVTLLLGLPLQRLLPSHGRPMEDARGALALLEPPLRQLYELQAEMRRNRVWPVWPHAVDQPKARVLPHLWANPHSVANCYALLADDGRALLLDYGFPSWDHMAADMRFVEHSLDELKTVAGLRSVDVVIPSHYHDDHLAGLPWLQQTQGTQAWIFENFCDMVANPAGYSVPCLLPQPIRVDRALPDRGSVSWDRWRFDVFHMPGHTWWALGLFAEIDGTRVAFTGDNLLAGTISPLRAAAPVYRNRLLHDAIALGVRRLMEFEPELLLTGHTGAVRVDRKTLQDFHGWAKQLDGVFTTLVAVPAEVNFALDPGFATLYPYRNPARPGQRLALELRVTNHGAHGAQARASLVAPPGWSATPALTTRDIAAGETGVLAFELEVPERAVGRTVVCADLTLGDRRFGQVAEALVDVAAADGGQTTPSAAAQTNGR